MQLEIGCMNRPWCQFTLDETLAAIAAAGYKTVQFCAQQGKHLITPESTDDELAALQAKLDQYGLTFDMISTGPNFGQPVADCVEWYRKLIPNVARMGGGWLMSCGVMDEALYDTWYAVMTEASAIAADHDIKMVLKPHGGIGATSKGLRQTIERVDHPNFSISYDPGNIYYYTGEGAEDDLPNIAEHVTCTCIKDERGGVKGEVMITPGTGVVDFARIYAALRDVGYNGPNWVECCGGSTVEEITAEAAKTKAFIEGIWAEL